jgi:small subunit ribosomal protein S9
MAEEKKTTPRVPREKKIVTPAVKPAPKAAAPKATEQPLVPAEYTPAVGRRKCAIARVRMWEGKGVITVNGKAFTEYFPTFSTRQNVELSLITTSLRSTYDISVLVKGGGSQAQSEAVRHGITRALIKLNQDLKKTLRAEGFVTRDPRVKERKKPGLRRARRAPQFSKR